MSERSEEEKRAIRAAQYMAPEQIGASTIDDLIATYQSGLVSPDQIRRIEIECTVESEGVAFRSEMDRADLASMGDDELKRWIPMMLDRARRVYSYRPSDLAFPDPPSLTYVDYETLRYPTLTRFGGVTTVQPRSIMMIIDDVPLPDPPIESDPNAPIAVMVDQRMTITTSDLDRARVSASLMAAKCESMMRADTIEASRESASEQTRSCVFFDGQPCPDHCPDRDTADCVIRLQRGITIEEYENRD